METEELRSDEKKATHSHGYWVDDSQECFTQNTKGLLLINMSAHIKRKVVRRFKKISKEEEGENESSRMGIEINNMRLM